jgi:hypothetical protein
MEKLPHYNFSWTVSLQNWTQFGRGYGPVARQKEEEEDLIQDIMYNFSYQDLIIVLQGISISKVPWPVTFVLIKHLVFQ